MSLIPHFSNELSPWPRIHLREPNSNAPAVDQRTTLPRLRRGSSQRSGHDMSTTTPRGRASSDAAVLTKSQVRGRGTSFGSTQLFEGLYGPAPVQNFDRKASDNKVQQLLKLRKQKLKEAKCKGDDVEVFRLKNLNLFDDIEKIEPKNDEPNEVESRARSTGQSNHHSFTSQVDVIDFGLIPRPKTLSHGHTAVLCWHLKLQYTHGLTVPEEFSQCEVHPTPSPCASSSSSLTLQSPSPSSIGSESKRSLRRTKSPSTSSSTLRDSFELLSPVTCSTTALEPSSPTKKSSIVPNPSSEDSFLYIAKYIQKHVKGARQFRQVKRPEFQASNADAKRSIHTQCTCTNHNCRTYLSGPPSKHCRFCKLPRPQPEIAAAAARIEKMMTSLLAQADTAKPAAEKSSEADEFRKFEALQEDMKLVEMYNAETEKRCRNGVWWEGWLIVEDLKRQGVVGSKPFVYDRDSTVP